ncbi:hypothetical protein SAMN05444172_9155 [Burkholderia sp. GAS332]|nr:hypothetical protein SAMN05444172_9155 [Burkholderia sp. GAS332]
MKLENLIRIENGEKVKHTFSDAPWTFWPSGRPHCAKTSTRSFRRYSKHRMR